MRTKSIAKDVILQNVLVCFCYFKERNVGIFFYVVSALNLNLFSILCYYY
jgi:hypothetical protein